MATYVNNLRLKEIATGDESGTWGASTNTNLELLGEALGFGTEAITTNADTHTTTIADGASDAGRALYIIYTGTLDSACTITIGPNTMKRVHIIKNGTSGSQNILISQGSGANVTIPAGDTKVVSLDGAGSGAAVTDVFASLNVVDLKVQDDLTVTDDMSVGGTATLSGLAYPTSDGSAGQFLKTDGSASLSFATVDTVTKADDIAAGDAAVNLTTTSGNITIDAAAGDADIIFKGTDDTTDITALTLDMSAGGDAIFRVGATFGASILPSTDDSFDLGSSSLQWRDIYTGDINLNNTKTRDNEVDGTRGSWTIQEGDDNLFILNRLNGKKYKFKLEEML